jgi:hypothetical protein
MNKYKNTTPYPMILECASGRILIAPGQTIETEEIITVQGIVKEVPVQSISREDKAILNSPKQVDIVTDLTKRFNKRFGVK